MACWSSPCYYRRHLTCWGSYTLYPLCLCFRDSSDLPRSRYPQLRLMIVIEFEPFFDPSILIFQYTCWLDFVTAKCASPADCTRRLSFNFLLSNLLGFGLLNLTGYLAFVSSTTCCDGGFVGLSQLWQLPLFDAQSAYSALLRTFVF